MKRRDFEELGNRMKKYEDVTNTSLVQGIPFIVRLDGKAFHTFTKGMKKPYDENMSHAMMSTCSYLVESFNASVGYTQSDEISLVFLPREDQLYSGRIQKISSVLASTASAKFNQIIAKVLPEKASMLPVFDARTFNVPDIRIAAEQLVWREADATRNSLTMAAHSHFTTKELHKKGFNEKHDMLHSVGVNWNDYPDFFKRGSYFKRVKTLVELTDIQLADIPEKYRPAEPIVRSIVSCLELPPLVDVDVAITLLFN